MIDAGQSLKRKKYGKEYNIFGVFIFKKLVEIQKRKRNHPTAHHLKMSDVIEKKSGESEHHPADQGSLIVFRQMANQKEHTVGIENMGKKKEYVVAEDGVVK